MTVAEICNKLAVTEEEIIFYENSGLIVRHLNGDFSETDFRKLGQIKTLLSAGMKADDVQTYLRYLNDNDIENQIRFLRLFRANLLEKIHVKQQDLDRIDYTIYQLSKK